MNTYLLILIFISESNTIKMINKSRLPVSQALHMTTTQSNYCIGSDVIQFFQNLLPQNYSIDSVKKYMELQNLTCHLGDGSLNETRPHYKLGTTSSSGGDIGLMFYSYVIPFIFVMGLVGNLLSLKVSSLVWSLRDFSS